MPTASEHLRKVVASTTPFIGAVIDDWQMFSDDPNDYVLGLRIGFGASSVVHAAQYKPRDGSPGGPCALKIVDLDRLPPQSLRLLRRETQLMSLSKHPNVLRVRGSWVDGHELFIALRLMNSGSAADVMRYGWPGGMEEEVVKCILKQALEGLNYLHVNGFIHRDIKAANLLIDDDGTVLLGDLGVAASLCDEDPVPEPSGSKSPLGSVNFCANRAAVDRSRSGPVTTSFTPAKRIGKRKSFVGTPCWMAPELIAGKQYDSKADIWSFGITAIELCQGRAPRSRDSPAKALLKTVQDAPPVFERSGARYNYSKGFKEMVESCLNKDPTRRPTAAELLETPFFKSAKRKSYLVGAILKDLPPLTSRQERRQLPNTRHSITNFPSWDFTVNNPVSRTSSVLAGSRSSHPPSIVERYHISDTFEESDQEPESNSDSDDSKARADHQHPPRLTVPKLMGHASSSSPTSSDVESSIPTTPESTARSSLPPSESATPLSSSPSSFSQGADPSYFEKQINSPNRVAAEDSNSSDNCNIKLRRGSGNAYSLLSPLTIRRQKGPDLPAAPSRSSSWRKLLSGK